MVKLLRFASLFHFPVLLLLQHSNLNFRSLSFQLREKRERGKTLRDLYRISFGMKPQEMDFNKTSPRRRNLLCQLGTAWSQEVRLRKERNKHQNKHSQNNEEQNSFKLAMSNNSKIPKVSQSLTFGMNSYGFDQQIEMSLVDFGQGWDDF